MAALIGKRYEILEALERAARLASSRRSTTATIAWSR